MAEIENIEEIEEVSTETEEEGSLSGKTYTEEEFNSKLDEVLAKKIARREAKMRKEYDRRYGELENVLKAGTGKEKIEEITDTLRGFYEQRGVQMPTGGSYSKRDIDILSKAEADEIINAGYEEVVDEVDRLNRIGTANMNERERAVFQNLSNYQQNTERSKALAKIGVGEEVYNSKEFTDFASKFAPSTPITDVYEIYSKTKNPTKDVKPMGSMKNNESKDSKVKEFYTRDEALKFTRKDFDKNPELYKAVENSMLKW